MLKLIIGVTISKFTDFQHDPLYFEEELAPLKVSTTKEGGFPQVFISVLQPEHFASFHFPLVVDFRGYGLYTQVQAGDGMTAESYVNSFVWGGLTFCKSEPLQGTSATPVY